jgi:hypothetical protein
VRAGHKQAFPYEESSPCKPGNDKEAEEKADCDYSRLDVLFPSLNAGHNLVSVCHASRAISFVLYVLLLIKNQQEKA